jgi:hypothetical protein
MISNPFQNQIGEINVDLKKPLQDFCFYPFKQLEIDFDYSDSANQVLLFRLDDSLNNHTGIFNFNKEGKHHIKVISITGLVLFFNSFQIENCEPTLYLPNSFSPIGFGINEIFQPKFDNPNQITPFAQEYLEIRSYDHQILFKTKNFNFGWNGGQCSSGSYLYYLKATDWWGKDTELKGTVFLVR